MGAMNEQSYVINGSMEQIIHILKSQQFYAELKMKLESEYGGQANAYFHFNHSVSFSSWGENVIITLTAQTPQTTAVTIQSKCSLPTQIIDWGKNKSNVDRIFAYINRNLMHNPASAYAATPQQYTQPSAPLYNQAAAPVGASNFCTNCGAPVNQSTNFCQSCGARLR